MRRPTGRRGGRRWIAARRGRCPRRRRRGVLGIQRKLHKWAKDDQARRFSDLHDLVCDRATLLLAWRRVKANRGSRSAGVDGQTAYHVEQVLGVARFLGRLREGLRSGRYRPQPVRERSIPKRGGRRRRLGIPTVSDRVVQAALKRCSSRSAVGSADGGARHDGQALSPAFPGISRLRTRRTARLKNRGVAGSSPGLATRKPRWRRSFLVPECASWTPIGHSIGYRSPMYFETSPCSARH